MTWNYRVVFDRGTYSIYEIYYDKAGNIEFFTQDSVAPGGDSIKELKQDLEWMLKTIKQPVLKLTELDKVIKKKKVAK